MGIIGFVSILFQKPGMIKVKSEVVYSNSMPWTRQFSQAAFILVGAAIIGRLITLLTQMVIAREFGVSIFSDAYFATEELPEFFISLITVGIASVFIPTFTQYRVNQGEAEALKFASSFLSLATIISLILSLTIMVCSPYFVTVLAPGFCGQAREVAIILLRIMGISVILLGPNAVMRGLLHSHKDFIVPEFARLTYNCILFAVACTLVNKMGVSVLAWAIVLATTAMAAIQILGVTIKGIFKPYLVFDIMVSRQAAKQLIPFLLAVCGIDVVLLLGRVVASTLPEGSVATLNYATRIILLPVGILALPLQTSLYPNLSYLAVRGQLQELAETTLSGMKIMLFIIVPACVGSAILGKPLVKLLFERGAFNHVATIATSEVLILYAAAVPAIAAIFFLSNVYYSLGDPYTIVKLNILGWTASFGMGLILSRYFGVRGIAMGTSLSMNLTAVIMIFMLKRFKMKIFDVNSLLSSLYKIGWTAAIMGLALLMLQKGIGGNLSGMKMSHQLLQLTILIVFGASTYLITAWVTGLNEVKTLAKTLVRISGRGHG